jgi:hypothetical protein
MAVDGIGRGSEGATGFIGANVAARAGTGVVLGATAVVFAGASGA